MTTSIRSAPPTTDQAGVADHLATFSRYEDRTAARAEEQLFIETPAGRLFATLVGPVETRRSVAFLSCHSFGHEQMELYPLELSFLRAAAERGFPGLTFQARGYGDSGGEFAEVGFGSHLRDALAAAAYLVERTSVDVVIPVGARFGGAVALVAASRLGAPGVALWDPALELGRYLDLLLMASTMSEVVDDEGRTEDRAPGTRRRLRSALAQGETVDVFGYPLAPAPYAEAKATAVVPDVGAAPARGLAIVVNRRRRKEVEGAATRMADVGIAVRVEAAEGPGREEFAQGMLRGGHLATHLALFEDVARRTIAWAEETW